MYTVIVSSLQGPKPVRLYKAADKQPTGNCLATTPTLCTVFTVSLAYVVVLFLTRCLRARVVFYMTQSSRFRLYFCCVPQFGKTQPSLWYADAIDPPPSCFFFFFVMMKNPLQSSHETEHKSISTDTVPGLVPWLSWACWVDENRVEGIAV